MVGKESNYVSINHNLISKNVKIVKSNVITGFRILIPSLCIYEIELFISSM
jgi:hypothetical protein